MKKVVTFAAWLLMSVLLMQFVWYVSEPYNEQDQPQAEKVNLALRRTADQLLKEAGDSTSQIPPVKQISNHVWLVRLERTFDYEKLPAILQASLDVHGIKNQYDVAVLRCADGTLQLGYNALDFTRDNNAPCSGRELPQDCYNLQVTLSTGAGKQEKLPFMGWFSGGMLAIALYSLGRKRPRESAKITEEITKDTDWQAFGGSRLDTTNQILICGNIQHQLTYREAKLLHLFVHHPNQVLKRSFIIEKVWADEGIMVDRSVDMFVSRLRKMLRDDPAVQLVAVHGVGYRMEITSAK